MTDSGESKHPENCPCIGCKVKTIQVSPKATPSKTPRRQQRIKTEGNSWEKGIVQDGRGMPHLNPGSLSPMPIKTYVENRQKIEEGKRRMAQAPASQED